MIKKYIGRAALQKTSTNEQGNVIPIKRQEVFTFYTIEKFLEAMAFARELFREDMERQSAEAAEAEAEAAEARAAKVARPVRPAKLVKAVKTAKNK